MVVVAGVLPALEPGFQPGGFYDRIFASRQNFREPPELPGFFPGGKMPAATAVKCPKRLVNASQEIMVSAGMVSGDFVRTYLNAWAFLMTYLVITTSITSLEA